MRVSLFLRCSVLVALSGLTGCAGSSSAVAPAVTRSIDATASGSARAAGAGGAAYLYVENNNSTLSAFSISKDGALAPVSGSPFASNTTSPNSFAIAVDPKGPYLYTTGGESNNVAIFAIDANGALAPVSDSTSTSQSPDAVIVGPKDHKLYVATSANDGEIDAFTLKGSGLKTVHGSPFPVTCGGFCQAFPNSLAFAGSYLYVVDGSGWVVSVFSTSKSGALTETASYPTGSVPFDLTFTPNGATLYVTNGLDGTISGYSVANGVLTPLEASPFKTGGDPQGIAVTPNGKFVYAANNGDGTLSGYAVGSGGALSALNGSPFADGSGAGPSALAIDQSGKLLFVANSTTSTIAVYAIASSGALTPVAGSPFTLSGGTSPRGLALYER